MRAGQGRAGEGCKTKSPIITCPNMLLMVISKIMSLPI